MHTYLRWQIFIERLLLARGPLPPDLSPYRPEATNLETVRRVFREKGFSVYPDPNGLWLSLEGSIKLFANVFGVAERALSGGGLTRTLPAPREVASLIEEIALAPPPELFS